MTIKLAVLAASAIFYVAGGILAKEKNRSPELWSLIAMVLPVLGLLILLFMQPKQKTCKACGLVISPKDTSCPFCESEVAGAARNITLRALVLIIGLTAIWFISGAIESSFSDNLSEITQGSQVDAGIEGFRQTDLISVKSMEGQLDIKDVKLLDAGVSSIIEAQVVNSGKTDYFTVGIQVALYSKNKVIETQVVKLDDVKSGSTTPFRVISSNDFDDFRFEGLYLE